MADISSPLNQCEWSIQYNSVIDVQLSDSIRRCWLFKIYKLIPETSRNLVQIIVRDQLTVWNVEIGRGTTLTRFLIRSRNESYLVSLVERSSPSR